MGARCSATAVTTFVLVACGSEPHADEPSPPAPAVATAQEAGVPCTIEHLASEPLTLGGGREVYVEPQTLAMSQEGTLLAGAPSYLWRRVVAPRGVVQEGSNLHLGVRRDSAGASPIPPPAGVGGVEVVRATLLPSGRSGAILATAAGDSTPTPSEVEAIWYAEYDGASWSDPEALPRPPSGVATLLGSTDLVQVGARLLWMVPWSGGGVASYVVEYERREGGWRHRVVDELEYADAIALASAPGRDAWLLAAGQDPASPASGQTLRLYRRADRWELVHRVTELDAGQLAYEPRLVVTGEGVTVAWRQLTRRGFAAMTAVDVQPGTPPAPIVLDPNALQVVPLVLHDGRAAWVVARSLPSVLSSELRVLVGTPAGPRAALTLPNPYTGYFAAATFGRRITIVGPEFDPHPAEPTVRSLFIDLGASCL